MPSHMPEASGKYVAVKDYVDDNQTGKMENRRSYSGIIL